MQGRWRVRLEGGAEKVPSELGILPRSSESSESSESSGFLNGVLVTETVSCLEALRPENLAVLSQDRANVKI